MHSAGFRLYLHGRVLRFFSGLFSNVFSSFGDAAGFAPVAVFICLFNFVTTVAGLLVGDGGVRLGDPDRKGLLEFSLNFYSFSIPIRETS